MRYTKRILFIAAAIAVVPVLDAADWSHWRGPYQTGVSPDANLPSELILDPNDPKTNLIWKAPYGCRSTPLVMNGRVYIINNVGSGPTEQERVMCFDADKGTVLWEYKFNVWHTGIVSSRLGWTNLAADPKSETVFAHGTQGLLTCLNKKGEVVWQRSLTEEFGRVSGYGGRLCSPVVADDLVIIGMNNSSWGDQKGGTRWVALTKDTGKVVWWAEPGDPPEESFYCVPAVAVIGGQKLLITGSSEGGIYALKVATGEKVWSYRLGTTMINCSPVVDGDLVYVGHGDENANNNIKGRIACLDAGTIKDGHPKEVWKEDGVEARFASPILHDGRVYFADDKGVLFCRDAKTGKKLWEHTYGSDSRGSPILADGKIYVPEVGSKFHVLKPGPTACEELDTAFFTSKDGKSEVELNGTPAVANGRLFFTTSEEIYCVGEKNAKSMPAKLPPENIKRGNKVTHLQIFPADVTVHPGDKVEFEVRQFDEFGNRVTKDTIAVRWSLPAPPLPPGAKNAPPPLKGVISDGHLKVADDMPSQQGHVAVEGDGLKAKARVRVAPKLPYLQDFEKVPDGAVPGGWVNAQGKFMVKTLKDGNKVLAKVTNNSKPLVARGNAYVGQPTDKDYTIECDVQGGKVVVKTDKGDQVILPEIGIVANRYTLLLSGNYQKLRLNTWDAMPRLDKTIPFSWDAGTWFTLKLRVDVENGVGLVRGKCWKKGEAEPSAWTIELKDSRPNTEGAPALYGNVLGHAEPAPGTDIYFDNLKITPNKK